MSLSTTSLNDDKTFSSEAQLNLRMFNEALPFAKASLSDDTSHKQAPHTLSSSASLPAVPRSFAEMQAISRNAPQGNFAELMAQKDMWLAWGRERRAAAQKDTDARMVVNQATKVKNGISGPPPTNDPRPAGKQQLRRAQSESIDQVEGHQRLKVNSRDHGNLDQNQEYRKKIKNLRRKLRQVEKDKQKEIEKLKRELWWAKSEKQKDIEKLKHELQWAKSEKQRAEYNLRDHLWSCPVFSVSDRIGPDVSMDEQQGASIPVSTPVKLHTSSQRNRQQATQPLDTKDSSEGQTLSLAALGSVTDSKKRKHQSSWDTPAPKKVAQSFIH